MTIFGAGALGRTYLLCFNEVFDLDEVGVGDAIPGVAERFADEMGEMTSLSIVIPSLPEAAVRDADLVLAVSSDKVDFCVQIGSNLDNRLTFR